MKPKIKTVLFFLGVLVAFGGLWLIGAVIPFLAAAIPGAVLYLIGWWRWRSWAWMFEQEAL